MKIVILSRYGQYSIDCADSKQAATEAVKTALSGYPDDCVVDIFIGSEAVTSIRAGSRHEM